MITIIDKSKCCGCTACVQRCPKQCITLKEDDEGFLYPHVEINKCIGCNLCEKVCPLINISEKKAPIKVLAVKNRNEEERLNSSSGGIFIALAKYVIDHGGVVFGAVFDEKWEVRHTYTENVEGIIAMMGSKYLQSRIENTFSEAEFFLKQGRKVMFTGTPCQIAGLRKFLKKEYTDLLLVDVLCHGVPSPKVWRKYLYETLKMCIQKNNILSNISNIFPSITSIEFRNKRLKGWKEYCLVVHFNKGFTLSKIHYNDSYMRGFISNIYLRPSCYQCKCKNGVSHSDLTIADFWGINILMPEFDDDKGVALVLLNTQKGETIFTKLDMDIRISSLKDAQKFNGGFKEEIKRHTKREYFFKKINNNFSVENTIIEVLKIPLSIRMINKISRIAKRTKVNSLYKKLIK